MEEFLTFELRGILERSRVEGESEREEERGGSFAQMQI